MQKSELIFWGLIDISAIYIALYFATSERVVEDVSAVVDEKQ